MAQILPENIIAGWKTTWDAEATITSVVPGGLWSGPVPQAEAGDPYAQISVSTQPPNWTSGSAFWQTFTIEVQVWSKAGATNAGTIRSAIAAVFTNSNKSNLAITGVTKIISLLPDTGDRQTEPRRKQAKDVLVTSLRWQLTLQGTT